LVPPFSVNEVRTPDELVATEANLTPVIHFLGHTNQIHTGGASLHCCTFHGSTAIRTSTVSLLPRPNPHFPRSPPSRWRPHRAWPRRRSSRHLPDARPPDVASSLEAEFGLAFSPFANEIIAGCRNGRSKSSTFLRGRRFCHSKRIRTL
jgi:hypothetical protein